MLNCFTFVWVWEPVNWTQICSQHPSGDLLCRQLTTGLVSDGLQPRQCRLTLQAHIERITRKQGYIFHVYYVHCFHLQSSVKLVMLSKLPLQTSFSGAGIRDNKYSSSPTIHIYTYSCCLISFWQPSSLQEAPSNTFKSKVKWLPELGPDQNR